MLATYGGGLVRCHKTLGSCRQWQRRCCSISELYSISHIQQALNSKKITAVEIVEEFVSQKNSQEISLSNFIINTDEIAFQHAKQIDQKISEGEVLPPLAAVPIAYKDNICTRGIATTAGSSILEGYIPPYDAHVVKCLKDAGCIMLGKTNMDQFGMGSTTENSAFQMSRNPWDTNRVPGGSSGGSASAVAAGQVIAALGTDTGGSIRQPAHFCGVVGFKPSYGLVSRQGLIAYASSLDVIGPIANSVHDAALMMEAIIGNDSMDATNQQINFDPNFSGKLVPVQQFASQPLKGYKIGVIAETKGGEGIDPVVTNCLDRAATVMESLGAVIEEVSIPMFKIGLPAYYVIATSEASSNLSRYDGVRYGQQSDQNNINNLYRKSRANGFSQEVKRRILMGTYTLSAAYYDAYYKRALRVRNLIKQSLQQVLDKFDFLLTPPAPSLALEIGQSLNDPLAMYKGDLMTVNVNLAGLPSIVCPSEIVIASNNKKLPCGVQFIGKYMHDSDLLYAAHVFEQKQQCPKLIAY